MRVLITGASGFIGKNFCQYLDEQKNIQIVRFNRENTIEELPQLLKDVDFVFHLAGINRPQDVKEFISGNVNFTSELCSAIAKEVEHSGRKIQVIFSSSSQVSGNSPYSESKRGAEECLIKLHKEYGLPVYIYRLPNVFGKWCRPHYNSVVATFCYSIARGLPITVNDAEAKITLVYIDDVVESFAQIIKRNDEPPESVVFVNIAPQYTCTVGELASQIQAYKDSRINLKTEAVGAGFARALYSTYMSFLPTSLFAYEVPRHEDSRGFFVEMIKTVDSGQISYFTSHPGVTRGGHYHHTKTEKFLVIKGCALFRFKNLDTKETYELVSKGGDGLIVETVPGWTHDVTNISDQELICAIWANEIFDRSRPDTFSCPI